MLSEREISAAVGTTAYGANGDKLGTVEHFFVDDRTGAPTWVSVTTGLFGTRRSVIPAVDATFGDGSLWLPVTAEAVRSAPDLAGGNHLDPAEEAELRRHYGLEPGHEAGHESISGVAASGPEPGGPEPGGTGRHGSPGPDAAAGAAPTQEMTTVPPPPLADGASDRQGTDGGMVRSEERLRVGTERVATTGARLVKYVV
ncbi:MAG: PRC-barrel domain-containing protein, partial [Actinomycetes bacterium]